MVQPSHAWLEEQIPICKENLIIISLLNLCPREKQQPSISEPLSGLWKEQNQCNGIARWSWEIDCWLHFRPGSWVGSCPTVSLGWGKSPELLCQQHPERCNRAPVWNWDENWAGSMGLKPNERLCSTSRCIISAQDCSTLATTEGCDFFLCLIKEHHHAELDQNHKSWVSRPDVVGVTCISSEFGFSFRSQPSYVCCTPLY